MYVNRIFQIAILDVHGRRIEAAFDFHSKSNRDFRGRTHVRAETEFLGFMTTARPTDRPHPRGDEAWKRGIYFKIY